MVRFLHFFSFAGLLYSSLLMAQTTHTADAAQTLGREAAQADIDLARRALERLHAGYDRYADVEVLAGHWQRLRGQASDGMTLDALYLGLSGILSALRCDHSKAELPRSRVEARETAPLYLPFRFRLFGGPGNWRMLVDRSADPGLERGDEILSIDGDPVTERVDAVWPLMAVDGYTDHARAHQIAASDEFLGSGFDHFDPLINPTGAAVQLRVARSSGQVRELSLDRVGFAAFRAFSAQKTRWRNFSDDGAVRLEYPRSDVAVLHVSTFVNYRSPVDPAAVFDPLFEELRERQVARLVVDLRDSGGGSVDVQEALIARLIQRPVRPVAQIRVRSYALGDLRPHLGSWSREALNPDPDWFERDGDGWILKPAFGGAGPAIQPHRLAFPGELIVLIGPVNSSGATTMIGAVREAGDALLVGAPTGGNQAGSTAGILYFLKLPNSGIRVRIPAQRAVTGFRRVRDGHGYAPDILAEESLDDWLAGRDAALEAALVPGADMPGALRVRDR